MNITIHYGTGVVAVPESVLQELLLRASKTDLCTLLLIASSGKNGFEPAAAADRLGVTEQELDNAISFWRGAGVISCADTPSPAEENREMAHPDATNAVQIKIEPSPAEEKAPPKPTLDAAVAMPIYSTEQITRFLDEHKETRELIDACQQTLGKMFNTADISSLIGMRDYLNLNSDYLLLLMAYCAKKGKKSLRYIEKRAIELHDSEIDTYPALEEHLRLLDSLEESETKLRALFGMNKRALTKKEKNCFSKWLGDFSYSVPIIEKAYEITIARINEPSIPYTSAILESWNKEGLKTEEEIDAFLESHTKEKKTQEGSSFDLDDFFEAALKRSYG